MHVQADVVVCDAVLRKKQNLYVCALSEMAEHFAEL